MFPQREQEVFATGPQHTTCSRDINRALQPGDSYQVPDLVGLSLTVQRGGALSYLHGEVVVGGGLSSPPAQPVQPVQLVPPARGGVPSSSSL